VNIISLWISTKGQRRERKRKRWRKMKKVTMGMEEKARKMMTR
jgi:hypothetical protein